MLLKYGERELTYSEVTDLIPQGLSPLDSTLLFRTIIDDWIREVVLSEFAEERLLDTSSIDRKVREYRNSLIVQEYLTRMRESQPPKIEEQKVKDYYDLHKREMKLEVPLVRGIFLKISSEESRKDEIKRLMTGEDPSNIDKLENSWLDRALEYNYFKDKWVDWNSLTQKIPYRFGDAETFLSEHNFFVTQLDDCSYYLFITDVLYPGEEQPFEFAKIWISDLLSQVDAQEYENSLVNSLVEKSVKEKKLLTPGYDPIKHEMVLKNEDNESKEKK